MFSYKFNWCFLIISPRFPKLIPIHRNLCSYLVHCVRTGAKVLPSRLSKISFYFFIFSDVLFFQREIYAVVFTRKLGFLDVPLNQAIITSHSIFLLFTTVVSQFFPFILPSFFCVVLLFPLVWSFSDLFFISHFFSKNHSWYKCCLLYKNFRIFVSSPFLTI